MYNNGEMTWNVSQVLKAIPKISKNLSSNCSTSTEIVIASMWDGWKLFTVSPQESKNSCNGVRAQVGFHIHNYLGGRGGGGHILKGANSALDKKNT